MKSLSAVYREIDHKAPETRNTRCSDQRHHVSGTRNVRVWGSGNASRRATIPWAVPYFIRPEKMDLVSANYRVQGGGQGGLGKLSIPTDHVQVR
jgi:hypothetical protein